MENRWLYLFKQIFDFFPLHFKVAFLGRSNSGKSSLLKAIFHNTPELKIQTSKNPVSKEHSL